MYCIYLQVEELRLFLKSKGANISEESAGDSVEDVNQIIEATDVLWREGKEGGTDLGKIFVLQKKPTSRRRLVILGTGVQFHHFLVRMVVLWSSLQNMTHTLMMFRKQVLQRYF